MATSNNLSKFSRSRKAAADYESNYGGLIMLMVLSSAIIAYVILTTPSEREALGIVPEKYARTLLDVSPGIVTKSEVSESKSTELNLGSIDVDFSAQKSTEPLRAQLSVKRSSYKDTSSTVPFSAKPDLESVVLEAVVSDKAGDGNLIVSLNGQEIFSQESNINQKISIPIPKSALLAGNTLEFSVSSPGAKLWQANSYSLLNVNLVTSAYAAGKAARALSFSLTSEQAINLMSAKLQAYVGKLAGEANLKISVNGKALYSGTRTGTLAFDIPIENLKSGANEIGFSVDKDGSYRVSFSKIAINYAKALTVAKKYNFFVNDYNIGQIAQNNLFCTLRIAKAGNAVTGNAVQGEGAGANPDSQTIGGNQQSGQQTTVDQTIDQGQGTGQAGQQSGSGQQQTIGGNQQTGQQSTGSGSSTASGAQTQASQQASTEFITARLNSHDLKTYFVEGVAQENICQYLIKGDNIIALGSDESVSIRSLKITVAAKQ